MARQLGFGCSCRPREGSSIISVSSPSPDGQNTGSHVARRTSITHLSRADSTIFIPGRTNSRHSRPHWYCATATACTRAPQTRQSSSDTTADRTFFDLHRSPDLRIHTRSSKLPPWPPPKSPELGRHLVVAIHPAHRQPNALRPAMPPPIKLSRSAS